MIKKKGRILIGISALGDPGLLHSGFYPAGVITAEDRLRYYASKFTLAESDASYHFLPTVRSVSAMLEATPPGFVFDIKAFSLFTQHPTQPTSFPRAVREKYEDVLGKPGNYYIHNLPQNLVDEIWKGFSEALQPLQEAGKLGLIMFQFPPWFHPSPKNYEYIGFCREKLPMYRLAIEFRVGSWLNDENREHTLQVLRQYGLSLVCVDEPQGLKSSVPPLAELTSSIGVVRFHGRNRENWELPEGPKSDRFNYFYSEAELMEWVPKIRRMAEKADSVHLIFKNKHEDFPVRNALDMRKLLG